MTESHSLENIETPRELTRARRKKWNRFALVLVCSTLVFGALEVLYNSPVLTMLGLRSTLRPYWHYITAVPVIFSGLWLCRMLITIPVFRRQRARAQHALDIELPEVLARTMRQRYEKSQRNAEALSKKSDELGRKFIKDVVWTLIFVLTTVLCYLAPKLIDTTSFPTDILSFGMFTGPYLFGIMGLARFGQSWEACSDWLEGRAKMREQLELKQDLAAVRREIHGEVSGAISTTAERFDGMGDMSMTRGDS